MRRMLHNKSALIGFGLIVIIVLCASLANVLSPNNPMKINMDLRFSESSYRFPLGADAYGRCVLSRLLYGARYSLGLAFLVMVGIVITTIPAGMAVTYKGGFFERIFIWLCDISMALPPTVLVLAIMGVMGNGIANLVFSTMFSYWGWYGRMVRSYTQTELAKGYVAYAITGGASGASVLAKQVFPNIFPGLIILFALGIGDTILMISGYSFLGIGLTSGLPEWGAMLSDAKSILLQSPQYAMYPGICVCVTVCAFNLFGEGMRKALAISGRGVNYE
jgi:ABC-type dipeptide/oligopeptide/nickel transport system permease subunit